MDKTIIELSAQDALEFVEFQKRFAFFQVLESLKVFDIRNGSVTINFDGMGGISSIDKRQTYRQ